MLKVVFLFHRLPGMEVEECSRYWRESHRHVCKKIPGLRKYVQNHAHPAPDGTVPAFDGLAELWFDDLEAYEKALATPEGQATIADTENFLDVDSQQVMFVDEVEGV